MPRPALERPAGPKTWDIKGREVRLTPPRLWPLPVAVTPPPLPTDRSPTRGMHAPNKPLRLLKMKGRPGLSVSADGIPSTHLTGRPPLLLTRSPGKQLLSTDSIHSTNIKTTTATQLSRGLCTLVGLHIRQGDPGALVTPSPYSPLSPLCLQCQPLGTRSASRPPPPPTSAYSSHAPRGSGGPGRPGLQSATRLEAPTAPQSHVLFPAHGVGPCGSAPTAACAVGSASRRSARPVVQLQTHSHGVTLRCSLRVLFIS